MELALALLGLALIAGALYGALGPFALLAFIGLLLLSLVGWERLLLGAWAGAIVEDSEPEGDPTPPFDYGSHTHTASGQVNPRLIQTQQLGWLPRRFRG